MESLSVQDIESELSYAYLHAVAARAGVSCVVAGRHEDNNGVDARLSAYGLLAAGGKTEVDLNIQLKATKSTPTSTEDRFSYFLREPERYNDLRAETVSTPRILVVLFLPNDASDWLAQDPTQLVLKHSAYWESLRGAPATNNSSGVTVYLPRTQLFDCDGLKGLLARLALDDVPRYPS